MQVFERRLSSRKWPKHLNLWIYSRVVALMRKMPMQHVHPLNLNLNLNVIQLVNIGTMYVISVRGHLSISLPYLLYSLLSPPALSTPTPLCAYVHIITEGRRPLSPIVDDFTY
jgi:hypothetical protein